MATMQADVDANEAASDAAELSLTTRLGVEEAARIAADASLVVKYDADIAALQADVDSNEADSDAAELSLTTRLGAEEVRAAAAEASIVTKFDADIAAENAARVAQEALVGADLAAIHVSGRAMYMPQWVQLCLLATSLTSLPMAYFLCQNWLCYSQWYDDDADSWLCRRITTSLSTQMETSLRLSSLAQLMQVTVSLTTDRKHTLSYHNQI